jgi:hypothetical protein
MRSTAAAIARFSSAVTGAVTADGVVEDISASI